jgi:hypothetical protein
LAQKAENHKKGVFFMKNTIKFLGIIALVAVIGFSIAACSDPSYTQAPTSVVLASGSHGTPGNAEIFDLQDGEEYMLTRGNNFLNWFVLDAAGEYDADTPRSLVPALAFTAALGGGVTEVGNDVLNGMIYNIFRVFVAADGETLGPGGDMDNRNDTSDTPAEIGGNGRNAIVDLRGLGDDEAISIIRAMDGEDVIGFAGEVDAEGNGKVTIFFIIDAPITITTMGNVALNGTQTVTTGTGTANWTLTTAAGQAGGARLLAVEGDKFFKLINVGDTRTTIARVAP